MDPRKERGFGLFDVDVDNGYSLSLAFSQMYEGMEGSGCITPINHDSRNNGFAVACQNLIGDLICLPRPNPVPKLNMSGWACTPLERKSRCWPRTERAILDAVISFLLCRAIGMARTETICLSVGETGTVIAPPW